MGRESIQSKETSMSKYVEQEGRGAWGHLWETGEAGTRGKEISVLRRVVLGVNLR